MQHNFVNSAIYAIQQLSAEIDETQAEIDELIRQKKQKMEEQREVLYGFVAEVLDSSPSEDHTKAIGNYLYWENEHVKASALSEILNVGLNHVCRYVGGLIVELPCRECGMQTTRTIPSLNSYEYGEWKRGRLDATCPECDRQSKERSRLASERYEREYFERVYKLRSMPYSEYLRTEHWHDVRRRALKRAGFACQVCNISNTQLHVHHRTYERRGEESNADVIVLCADCHRTFHENGKVAS